VIKKTKSVSHSRWEPEPGSLPEEHSNQDSPHLRPDGFLGDFIHPSKREMIPILYKLFQIIDKEGMLNKSLFNTATKIKQD